MEKIPIYRYGNTGGEEEENQGMFEEDTSCEDIRLIKTKKLQELLDCEYKSAVKIGKSAGARLKIGGLIRWRVKNIREYMDKVQREAAG